MVEVAGPKKRATRPGKATRNKKRGGNRDTRPLKTKLDERAALSFEMSTEKPCDAV